MPFEERREDTVRGQPVSPRRSLPHRGGGGEGALFRTLAAAGLVLPFPALRTVARGAAALLPLVSPRLRRALDLNSKHLLGPGAGERERRALARAQLRSFADFAAEVSTAGRPGARLGDLLAGVEGTEHLAAARAPGRGLVAVTLHLGNYELAAAALAGRIGGKVAVVYDRDPARAWERRRTRWRRRAGLEQIALDASPFFGIEALSRLRAGGAVLLAGDRGQARSGERFTFLGALACFSTLPARLARAAGCPLLPAFAVREAAAVYRLHLEAPVFPDGLEPRELTGELVAVYERYLKQFPDQWLMVRPFWEW